MGRIQFGNGAPAGPPHLGSDELHIDRETGAMHFLGPDDAPKVGGLPALDAVPSTYRGGVIRVGADLWEWKLRLAADLRANFEDLKTITLAGHSNAAMNTTYTLSGVNGGYVLYVSADGEYQISLGADEAYLDDEGNGAGVDEHDFWTIDGEPADFLSGAIVGESDGATVAASATESGSWARDLGRYVCGVWRRNLYRVTWKTDGATKECAVQEIHADVDCVEAEDNINGGVNYVAADFQVSGNRVINHGEYVVRTYQRQATSNNNLVGIKTHVSGYEQSSIPSSKVTVYLQTDVADAFTRTTFVEIWVRNLYTFDELN